MVTRQAGGLEGLKPSKKPAFRLLWAALPPIAGEKEELRGRHIPRAPHRVSLSQWGLCSGRV
jgi:hypothetical protein